MKKLLPILFLCLAGCTSGPQGTVIVEAQQTEINQKKLAQATPPPYFDHSLEREMLVRRLKTLNVQNKLMYIYLLSWDGKVIMHDVVQGKVSSLNSLLTTPEQLVCVNPGSGQPYRYEKLPSPDFDGSYGKNPDGIFWFSSDGGYNEWFGPYFVSDRPKSVNTPVSLTATVDLDKRPVEKK